MTTIGNHQIEPRVVVIVSYLVLFRLSGPAVVVFRRLGWKCTL